MMKTEHIPNLPVDVIIHIMTYMSVSDRKSMSLVNKSWYEAALCAKFVNQQTITFNKYRIHVHPWDEVINLLQRSTRPFVNFVCNDAEGLIKTLPLWEKFGPNMRSLALVSCDLGEQNLVDILRCCNSLILLRIEASHECFMTGRLLINEEDVKELKKKFKSLRDLSLAYNRYLSDALFNRLIAICSNLESLNLEGCQISFHSGLVKKFYPNQDPGSYTPSESVLTFFNIMFFIGEQANGLKHLNFSHTNIDGNSLIGLSVLAGLKLESLILKSCGQLSTNGIKELTAYQVGLKVLNLSFCPRITDASVCCICKNLNNLESLSIRRCGGVTDLGIGYINLLSKLKVLDISECEKLTGQCIMGFTNQDEHSNSKETLITNLNLIELSVSGLNLDETSVEIIINCFPNLRFLDLGYCFIAVTNRTLKMIIQKLVFLKVLKLNNCYNISDVGLIPSLNNNNETGDVLFDNTLINEHLTKSINNELKISLGSRMEQEIILEAKRINETKKNIETIESTLKSENFIQLKDLVELNLSGCNQVTDLSLRHAFAFSELKRLDLTKCQQITHQGLDHLTKNNPAIEILKLSDCHNVTDDGVAWIAQRLHRLKKLHLKGCCEITDHSIESIKLNHKSLWYLDISNCEKITNSAIESITNLLYVEHTKVVYSDEPWNFVPTPPEMNTSYHKSTYIVEKMELIDYLPEEKERSPIIVHNCKTLKSMNEWKYLMEFLYPNKFGNWFMRQRILTMNNSLSRWFFKSTTSVNYEIIRHLKSHSKMIHPFSSFRIFWETLNIIFIVMALLVTPLFITFYPKGNYTWHVLRNFIDSMSFCDLIVWFFTGYYDYYTKSVVLDSRIVARKYLTGFFWIDILSMFPFETIGRMIFHNYVAIVYCRMFNLMKIIRMRIVLLYLRKLRYVYNMSLQQYEIIKMSIIIVCSLHWGACLEYYVPSTVSKIFGKNKE